LKILGFLVSSAMILPVNGFTPQIDPSCWIAPNATIIGDVALGKNVSIWFGTVLRGDVFAIRVGDESNIQDNCTVHGTYKKVGTTLGKRVSVGHGVILHGTTVGDGCLIGMGSVLMDNSVIGRHCLVGAGSLVTEGSVFEDECLIIGRPAVVKRKLTKEEVARLEKSADNYLMYTKWYC